MATPYWERFCTPLAHAILAILQPRATPGAGPDADAPYILEETIQAVLGDGRYQVGDDALPTKGRASLTVGQRVHVLWQRGKRRLILTHQWQRAQGGPEAPGGYAVEELFFAEADTAAPAGAQWDVYFRNDAQVTRLNLHATINADRVPAGSWSFGAWGPNDTGVFKVGWGEDDSMFWVMTLALRPTGGIRYPRFYVFRLSRAEGVPAGADTVTASLVATVDMPVFTMADKYGSMVGPATTPTPPVFPDDMRASGLASPINGFVLSEIILLRDAKVVMVVPRRATNGYGTFTALPVVEEVTYLVAVRSDLPLVIWESPVTDANRASPPFSSQGGAAVAVPYTAYQVDLLGFAVREWTDAAKHIATSWQAKAIHDTNVAPRVFTVVRAQRAVFVEDGTAVPAQTIQPWTTFQMTIGGGTVFVESEPARQIQPPASAERVLLTGIRYTSVAPDVLEGRIELWNGSTLEVLALQAGDVSWTARVAALRLFPARTTYAIAENAAGIASWPTEAERARFVLLTGTYPLNPGTLLVEDTAHQGPLAPLPVGVTEPDGAAYPGTRFAYHVVGAIT